MLPLHLAEIPTFVEKVSGNTKEKHRHDNGRIFHVDDLHGLLILVAAAAAAAGTAWLVVVVVVAVVVAIGRGW